MNPKFRGSKTKAMWVVLQKNGEIYTTQDDGESATPIFFFNKKDAERFVNFPPENWSIKKVRITEE